MRRAYLRSFLRAVSLERVEIAILGPAVSVSQGEDAGARVFAQTAADAQVMIHMCSHGAPPMAVVTPRAASLTRCVQGSILVGPPGCIEAGQNVGEGVVDLRWFASDNNAGVHPEVMAAIEAANTGHAIAYGDDPVTTRAAEAFERILGDGVEVFPVLTGTCANVLCMQAATRPHNSIICPDTAHLHEDECGAPERFTGCKVLGCPTTDGKLRPQDVKRHLVGIGFEHHSQPRVVSISQSTEVGTVYTPEEVRALADLCHENGLVLHMDGARLANAAVSLGLGLREITRDCGVDMLSFGATKNGALAAEAVVFFDCALAKDFAYIRKQGMQLASKMRFVSAQLAAILSDDLWERNARSANRMAARLAAGLEGVDGVTIAYAVEANAVFAHLPRECVESLQAAFPFYLWEEETSLARLMCSYDTTEEEVDRFLEMVRCSNNTA